MEVISRKFRKLEILGGRKSLYTLCLRPRIEYMNFFLKNRQNLSKSNSSSTNYNGVQESSYLRQAADRAHIVTVKKRPLNIPHVAGNDQAPTYKPSSEGYHSAPPNRNHNPTITLTQRDSDYYQKSHGFFRGAYATVTSNFVKFDWKYSFCVIPLTNKQTKLAKGLTNADENITSTEQEMIQL